MISTGWKPYEDATIEVTLNVDSKVIEITEGEDLVQVAPFEVDDLIKILEAARDQLDEIARQDSEAQAND